MDINKADSFPCKEIKHTEFGGGGGVLSKDANK